MKSPLIFTLILIISQEKDRSGTEYNLCLGLGASCTSSANRTTGKDPFFQQYLLRTDINKHSVLMEI